MRQIPEISIIITTRGWGRGRGSGRGLADQAQKKDMALTTAHPVYQCNGITMGHAKIDKRLNHILKRKKTRRETYYTIPIGRRRAERGGKKLLLMLSLPTYVSAKCCHKF